MTDRPRTVEGDSYWTIKGLFYLNPGEEAIELEHEYTDSETGPQCAYVHLTEEDLKAMSKLLEERNHYI